MNECRVEVEVYKGRKSLSYGVRVNGVSIPNVTKVSAVYVAADVRRVTIELFPTDFVEVEREKSEQALPTGDTVGVPRDGTEEVVNGQDQEAPDPGA